MQKNKRMRISETGKGTAIVYKLADGGQNRSTNSQKGNKTTVHPRGGKMPTPRNNRSLRSEDDASDEQRIYNKAKLCVICGSSDEVVDLSSNPIMKKTMASYCEGGGVNIDDCLSSICLTCVFKSRAVKEVQNNITLRLYGLSSGLMLKTTEKNEINYDGEEYIEGIQTGEANAVIKAPIEFDCEKKLKITKRTNGVSGSFRSPPNPIGSMEANETSPRLPTASLPYKHPSCTPFNKRINKGRVFDNSVDDGDNKSTVQLANYKLTKTSHVLSNQHQEAIHAEYNTVVKTSHVLSNQHQEAIHAEYNTVVKTSFCQEVELMAISKPNSKPSSRSNSTHSPNGINHSMLQVIRERSEPVLITESGGKINNYKRTSRPQTQRLCQYCGTSYLRKDHYSKHVRRCRNLSSRSLPSIAIPAEENKETVSAKRVRMNGATNCITSTSFETSKRARKFHCTECLATLDNIAQLRQHRATHLRQYNCDMCDKKFTSLHEHDFHRIVCLAEKQVLQERELDQGQEEYPSNDDKKSVARSTRSATKSITNRPVTRAQSRVQTRAQSRAQSRARTDVMEKPTVRRRLTVLTSVSQYMYDHTDDENSDTDDRYTGDDSDDDVSVADSMDSRRRVYTDDWLDRRNVSCNFDMPAMQIDSEKEYDLYLLERLKAQIKAQEFTCLAEDCGFFTDTLLNLMLHDYVHHFKSSWFYCQKCGSVFTSKVFLDYHLDRQNGGRFICYKCNEQFMFQHEFDTHLIAHSKQMNHACDKCKCEFLTEGKLFQHIRIEHNSEIEKKEICIQSKTTFASSRSLDENGYINGEQHRKYIVKILNMHLPRMPSKRPMELPGHKPYRRRIGVIEFENERNPNCCSCK